jgi:hypothetical protein
MLTRCVPSQGGVSLTDVTRGRHSSRRLAVSSSSRGRCYWRGSREVSLGPAGSGQEVSLALDRLAGGHEQLLVESLRWGSPAEGLARSTVQGGGDRREVIRAVAGEVGAFREVLA